MASRYHRDIPATTHYLLEFLRSRMLPASYARRAELIAISEMGLTRTCSRPCVQFRGELCAASCLISVRLPWREGAALRSIFTIGNALSTNPKIAIGLLSPVGLLFALPILLWAFSFTELFGLEKCSIGSVSDVEYQRILSRAGAQRWTVWPGLSNGVFWPSDNGFRGPTASFKSNINDQLVSHVRELAGPDASMNRLLASGHAVMRSMGAEYVQTEEVPGPRGDRSGSRVRFTYYMPQVRFAPVCVLCLIWWDTTIDVMFSHEVATGRYELQQVTVQHAGLKGAPDKNRARNVPWGSCPQFQISRQVDR